MLNKKVAGILSVIALSITTIGFGTSDWYFVGPNKDVENETGIITGDFIFKTLNFSENNTIEKLITSTHNIRCDGPDLGTTMGSVNLANFYNATPVSSDVATNPVKYVVLSGNATINGDTLTTTATSGNVIVNVYEEGYPNDGLKLTFANSTTDVKAEHTYSQKQKLRAMELGRIIPHLNIEDKTILKLTMNVQFVDI